MAQRGFYAQQVPAEIGIAEAEQEHTDAFLVDGLYSLLTRGVTPAELTDSEPDFFDDSLNGSEEE